LVAELVLIQTAKNMRYHINLKATIKKKYEPQSVSCGSKKFCPAVLSDSSGEFPFALWQKDINRVSVGDRVYMEEGITYEYRGKLYLTRGFWGKLVVLAPQKPKPIWPPEFVHETIEPPTTFEQRIPSLDDHFEKAKMWRQFFRESLS